jgi:quercetin dioxygenase-like cupin family protein/DNA-binding XRE family transcriptional regulator
MSMARDTRTGAKLTTLRDSLGLTVAQLAQRSGCDVVVIEQLEAGELAPSLATLLDDDMQIGPIVMRADEPQSVPRLRSLETGTADCGQLEFFSLAAGKSSRHMEPFRIVVHAGAGRALSTHEGEEVIYVLDGRVEVEYGKDVHVLGVGDSIYYDSIVPHEVRAAGDDPATILAVVYAPF